MMNPGTAQEIAKAATNMNWSGVFVILFYITIAIGFVLRLIVPLYKDRKEGKLGLTDEAVNSIASRINVKCQIGPGGSLSDLPDRLLAIRRILEDMQSEVHTNHKGIDSIDSRVDEVLDILSDLVRSIRQSLR